MTWQEELRKLDEDFSSGIITADEYRVRRDQVLSSAVAPQRGDQSGVADQTQIVPPVHRQPQGNPPPADATQIVPHANADAERTQAVSPEMYQQHDMYQQPSPPRGFPQHDPHSPAHGFPHQSPPSPAAGFPQQPSGGYQQQAAWHSAQTQEDATPLWGGDEFPPIAPPADEDWITQGPEHESSGTGRTGKIIGVVVAVVLLAGIAIGAWALWGQDSGQPTADPGKTTSEKPAPTTPPSTPPENENLPLAQLDGEPAGMADVAEFSDVATLKYLTDGEASAYEKAGAGEANFQSTWLANGNKAVILLTQASDERAAQKAAAGLPKIQRDNGAKKAKSQPDGVGITEYTDKKSKLGQIRAHYS
ncbi:MAG: hypothetical protein ACRDQF_09160, partial [Thermocrispum sp.]